MLRLHVGHLGEAEMPLQEHNRVSLSRGVYTLAFAESSQAERVQPLSRHTCVNVYMCVYAAEAIWRLLEATASLT